MLRTLYQWVVYSSTNEEKLSLTIQGVAGTIVTGLIFLSGISNLGVPADDFNNLLSLFMAAVHAIFFGLQAILAAVSAWAVVWGATRKIWTTVTGTNAVIAGIIQR